MAIVVPVISTFDSRGITKAIRDFKKLDGAGQRSAFALLNTDKAFTSATKTFAKFGGIAAGVAGVIGGSFANAAYESQKVMRQTEAIIKATGSAAGMTSKQIADLAGSLSMKTGVDDEAIQTGLNLLLTFKQIRNEVGEGNDIFNRASALSLDLANVFGSVDAAAIQLGKALSNPIKGVTALQRSGINFTDQQKEQIKTLVQSGKVLDAQKMILKEIESQVGGTAAASATGFDRMKVAIGNVQEELGGILIPYIERFATFVVDRVVPVMSTFADIVGEKGVGAGITYLTGSILNGISSLGTFGKLMIGLGAAFVAVRVATISYTAAMGAMKIVTTLSDGAVAQLITRLGQAKIAMLAAGGITALLTLAAAIYGAYAKQKSKAQQATVDFVDALELEGDAQAKALANLYRSNPAFKNSIDVLTRYGATINLLKDYVNGNANSITDWGAAVDSVAADVARIDQITTSANPNIDAQAAAYDNLRQKIPALRNATKEQIDTFITSIKLFQSMRKETQATTDALAIFTAGQNGANGSTNGFGSSVDKAKEKVRSYVSALKGFGSDQKSYTKAIKDTTTAKQKLETATNKVSVAQARYDQIVRGYGAGSDQAKAAQEALDQAQRDHTRATLDSEKAAFAVTDAEAELNTLRASGTATAQEIREAEIALQEAKLAQTEQTIALRDANNEVIAAQTTLNELINGATTESETYKEALKELNDAKADEAEAANNVAEAIDREAEAKLRLAEAERELTSARGGVSKGERAKAEKQTGVVDITGKRKDFLAMVNKQFGTKFKSIQGYIDAGKNATSRADRKQRFNEFAQKNGIPQMARGGIVSQPTFALIGEKAPEAVIPLDRLAGGGDTYIVNINSKIADETLPDLLVAELRKFNRRSGAINIQVA
jgi:hypothetical protein